MNHGTRTAYVHHRCRCPACTAANTKYCVARRRTRDPADAPAESHGKVSTYSNWNCRCVDCSAAGAAALAFYMRNRDTRE